MDKKTKDENMHIFHAKEEMFLNEYNWEISKKENGYSFKIRLNTDNTILFLCTISNINNEKIYFENIFSLNDLHHYDRFKNNENINDIYIYLLTMIQENHFDFEKKEENKLILLIKPYTSTEKIFKFILERKLSNNKKCEICDRIHSGINYLRFIRDNNHNQNIISSNNNINYNINCNYNNINNNDGCNDKNIISKILEEIKLLKKENLLKNEEIKNLKKEIIEQNQRLTEENCSLKEEINKMNNKKNFDENKNPFTTINVSMIKNSTIKNIKVKKIFLKTFKYSFEIFTQNPNELKYNSSIIKNISSKGVNDIFEVFISNKDKKEYLISKNAKTHSLDIILLKDNQIINSLKGHKNTVTMVRYFLNYKGKNEYLISADIDKNVIIWDINNNYNILHLIKTEYIDNYIYSCYLFFDNFDNNFIFTSCGLNRYKINDTSFTKMYSFKTGNFEKNIRDSNYNNTYYLLIWYNENDKINYLVECCEEKIVITNFVQNELYAKFLPVGFKVLKYYSAFIFNSENKFGKDLLCCSTSNGLIVIWNLINKQLFYCGKISKVELYNIIPWSKKYIIISGGSNKSIKIFDIETLKEVNNIQTDHSSNINCVKKILHPEYGESLLTSGNDHQIKLWTI